MCVCVRTRLFVCPRTRRKMRVREKEKGGGVDGSERGQRPVAALI